MRDPPTDSLLLLELQLPVSRTQGVGMMADLIEPIETIVWQEGSAERAEQRTLSEMETLHVHTCRWAMRICETEWI
jgi:hypothetical protein